jgi:hypothetical protein
MMARMDSQLEKVEACLGKTEATNLEASPEETEFEVEREEVPKEEATVETFGALKKQYKDWHLVIRCRGQPKKWTQGSGGSQRKLAAACRGITYLAGVTRPSGTRQGQSYIRNRDLKEELHLKSKGNVNKTFRETLGLEIMKRIARSSVRIQIMSVRTLWRGQPPPKRKQKPLTAD